jgi:hypothetical protein
MNLKLPDHSADKITTNLKQFEGRGNLAACSRPSRSAPASFTWSVNYTKSKEKCYANATY